MIASLGADTGAVGTLCQSFGAWRQARVTHA